MHDVKQKQFRFTAFGEAAGPDQRSAGILGKVGGGQYAVNRLFGRSSGIRFGVTHGSVSQQQEFSQPDSVPGTGFVSILSVLL
jgi:hypothetical protein